MMSAIRWPIRRATTPEGIDLGGGWRMPAEDVLDGHSRRLMGQRTVRVQTEENLAAAITVLAPELLPLTNLAEDLADAVSDVTPAPQFRQDLHRALEMTHRQHAAQRVLGTQPFLYEDDDGTPSVYLIFSLMFATAVLMALWVRRTRRPSPVVPPVS